MKIEYRPEINGLRTISILLVTLYHAEIQINDQYIFKGGYVGVDIFFVISGYLITSILLKELKIKKKLNLKYFYERRARRILPVFLFVMLVALPFAWQYLLPINLVDLSKSILFSLGFSSNYYFWYNGNGYGAENSFLLPFLHTWSLSVEEQFYILFPVVLLIIFKYFRKYLIHILILGFIISLGFAEWGSRNHPSLNFYVLPTRVWELLAGSILAYFEINNGHRSKNKTLNLILPTIGLLLIGHYILFFNDDIYHPSFLTLSPIIGVCLVIWFSNKNELITKILSTKLFVGIGLISYSLYLWHYPIFAIARNKSNLFFDNYKIELLLLSIVLSIFSYFFIEKKFRNKKQPLKFLVAYIFATSILVISISSVLIFKKGLFLSKNDFLLENFTNEPWLELKNNNNQFCYQMKITDPFCDFIKENNKEKIILVGDSTIESMSYSFKKKFFKNGYNIAMMNSGHCYFNPHYDFNGTGIEKFCSQDFQDKRMKFINQNPNSTLIIGGELNFILDSFVREDRFYIEKYILHIDNLLSQGFKIYQLIPTPRSKINVGQYFLQDLKRGKITFKNNILKISSKEYYKNIDKTLRVFNEIKHTNYKIVDFKNLFCDKNYCYLNDEKNIFFIDQSHPSHAGSEKIVNFIFKLINDNSN